MPGSPVIEVKKASKFFGKGDSRIRVLNKVSLKIYSGEYVILFGPSGCGKSTLLNIIAGLETPEDGSVLIRGKSLKNKTDDDLAIYRRDKVGMVFQQFNLIKEMNVIDNVALPQSFKGIELKTRSKRAKSLLGRFKLGKFAKRKPTEMSGGQQQRVAISRALVNNPWIMLVDEPTGNLDSKSSQEVMEILGILCRKSRRTILLVTHNSDYLHFADRVIYMQDGEIIKEERHHNKLSVKSKKFKDVFGNGNGKGKNFDFDKMTKGEKNEAEEEAEEDTVMEEQEEGAKSEKDVKKGLLGALGIQGRSKEEKVESAKKITATNQKKTTKKKVKATTKKKSSAKTSKSKGKNKK